MIASDGRMVWLGDIVTVVTDGGRPAKLRGIMIDITERKEAESKARRNHERMRALHEINLASNSSLDMGVILDVLMQKIAALLPHSAVLIWLRNDTTGRLERAACFNIDREAWVGPPLGETPALVRAVVETVTFVISKNVRTDPRVLDREFYTQQGIVSYLGVPLAVEDQVFGALLLLTREEHDFPPEEVEFLITLAGQAATAIQKSRLYEQIKTQAAQLESANREICNFTALIAHDLRSPLNQVLGVSELMTDSAFGPVTDEQKKWLRNVTANVGQLVALVDDFLDVSKLESGRLDLTCTAVDLGKLIADAVENYRFQVKKKEIAVRQAVSDLVPRVPADQRRVEQVLNNLLSNALKFTPQTGEIEIGASSSETDVKIWVRDTGAGIAAEEMGDLFQKYKQTASGRISEHKGTGLGLVICKMIVEAHGGKIWAESEQGNGAKFVFTLPAAQHLLQVQTNRPLEHEE